MEFPRQECWSGLLFPPPRDLPDPGIEPTSLALAGGFFTTEPPGKPVGQIAGTLHTFTRLWKPPVVFQSLESLLGVGKSDPIILINQRSYRHAVVYFSVSSSTD